MTSDDCAQDCCCSTWVDSALAGSQFCASFFSALVSLPASGPASATMISQNATTTHLARRPAGSLAIEPILLMKSPPLSHPAPADNWPAVCARSQLARLVSAHR